MAKLSIEQINEAFKLLDDTVAHSDNGLVILRNGDKLDAYTVPTNILKVFLHSYSLKTK